MSNYKAAKKGHADLDGMHQPKLAILCLVHASVQKLPLEKEQLSLPTGFAPVISWSLAWTAESDRRSTTSVEGHHAGQHLHADRQQFAIRHAVESSQRVLGKPRRTLNETVM